MPSDIILDSLCTEKYAWKTFKLLPSLTPEYPYKSLGARHDTVFFNTATQYTIDLWIQGSSRVFVKDEAGEFKKVPKNILIRMMECLSGMVVGGAFFYGIGRGGGERYADDMREYMDSYDLGPLLDVAGGLRLGLGKIKNPFDHLCALLGIKQAIEYFMGDREEAEEPEEPYTPGKGALKPKVYEAGTNTERDSTSNQKKEGITIPAKPKQFPTSNTPSLGGNQAQHLQIQVTIVPAKDTLRLANKDSSSIMNVVNGVNNKSSRDKFTFDGVRDGKRIREEELRRVGVTYYIQTTLYPDSIGRINQKTGEWISKQEYEKIKRSE